MHNSQTSRLSPRRRKTSATASIGRVSLITGALLMGAGTTLQAAPEAGDDRFPLTVESMDAKRAEVFATIDTNGDGLISAEEFDAHEPAHRAGRRSSGSERDGGARKRTHHRPQLSQEQIAAMDESLFHRLDGNGDSVLSRDEFSQEAIVAARRDLMKERIFAHADQNEDGYLSPDEFPPRRLSEMDTNADGEVTRDELRGHHRPSAS